MVIVRDPDGQEDSALITIDLTNVDDPTVTQSDINQTNEDATLTVNAAKGVLSNDTDVDDTLTVASFKVADDDTTYDFGDTAVIDGVGEFTLNADGSYEFVPVANFNGDVPTITYTTNTGVSDTLDIDVVAQNDPTVTQSDTNQTNEDTTLTVNAANGVLSNDSDVDDTLTVATFKVAGDDTTYNFGEKADIDGVGEFMLNADGSYEFVPADNFNGDVPTVTYTTNTGASDTLDIDVVAQDDPTVTGSDTNQTNEDTTLTVNAATGVLSNDSDVDDTLSVATFKVAGDDTTYNSGETADIDGVGEFTLNADGSYEFVPAVNFNGGVPTITYTTNTGVSDTLDIDVVAQNDPTVTQSDTNQTNEDATLTVNAANGVLSNDTDVDDTLTVASFKVANDDTTYSFGETAEIDGVGEITLNADGSYEFVPAADFNGDVPTITYTTNTGASDTLDIDVVAKDDPTVTVEDTNQTNEDATLTVNAANGVLSNDTDVDDTLTVASFKVANDDTTYSFGETAEIDGVGGFTLNADGSYEFVPAADFNGDVPIITYTTNTGASDTLDIDVVAQDDPTVTASDTNQTNEDATLTVNAANGVLSNDTDVDDTLTVASFKVANDDTTYSFGETAEIDGVGEFTLNADGSYEFVPAADFNGDVPIITYTTNTGASDTLDIDVVAQDDPTVTASDTNQTNEDTTLTVNAANGVLNNDTDVDDTLTVASFKVANDDTTYSFGDTAEIDGVGEITLNADGSYEFVPAADFNGDVPTITYTTNTGASDTLDIDVVAQDDPTVTAPDTNQTNEDTTLTVNAATGVLSNDSDVDDTLTVATFQVAGDDTTYNFGETADIDGVGEFTLNADGSYEFVPADNFNGDVPTVTYTTNTGASDTLDIDVVAQDDPTVTGSDTNQTNEDTTLTVNAATGVLSNDSDVDDTLTVATFKVAGDDTTYNFGETADIDGVGEFTLNADGSYEFVPASNFNGDVPTITYTTNTGASDTLDIDVVAQNDPTVTQSDTNQTNEDTTLTVNAANGVLSNDSDPDDTLTVATFKVSGDGTTYNTGMTAIIAGIGSITVNANGSYEFVPGADFNGDVPTITYTTNTGVSDTLDIDVAPQADPTITVSDSNQTNEDTTLTVNAVNGVLSNDSDADGPLSVATFKVFGDNTDYVAGDSVGISGIGTVTLNGDGSYEFVPFANFSGTVLPLLTRLIPA
ncbi:T1SS secreted agglutinin RTX [Vibrio ishigakensis]|uniref:T1SS secreted agglutinin RTX n=1 Tax=Vibrio ishigakensis TaxID=1481914 RepID=A0A0B8QKC6_9VIBR|nr:T1SS secreted agglutinin RTX [Vibrio ishigakensis]